MDMSIPETLLLGLFLCYGVLQVASMIEDRIINPKVIAKKFIRRYGAWRRLNAKKNPERNDL